MILSPETRITPFLAPVMGLVTNDWSAASEVIYLTSPVLQFR
jgi:hypothetical protein